MKKLLIALAFVSTCAHAEFFNGNDLLAKLNDTNSVVNRAIANGYVAGVFDAGFGVMHCASLSISVKQAADVVRLALESSPADRDKAADALVLRALGLAWPCQNKGRGQSM